MLEKYKKYLKFKDYHAQYYNQVKNFIKWLKNSDIEYIDIDYNILMDYILYLKSENLENGTINNYIKSIRFFYRYLIDNNLVNIEILEDIYKIKLLKTIIKIHSYLIEEELEEIIEMGMTFCYRMDPFKLSCILRFLFYTGLRKNEFIRLKRSNFDFRNKTVSVKGKTKNRQEREVPLTNELTNGLQFYFSSEPEEKNAFNFSEGQLVSLLKDLQDFAPKNKKLSPHILRHSYGRLLARKGVNVRVAQKLLGHKNISSTLIYYDVTIDEAKKIFWEKIG